MKKFRLFLSLIIAAACMVSCGGEPVEVREISETETTTEAETDGKPVIRVGSLYGYDELFGHKELLPQDIDIEVIDYNKNAEDADAANRALDMDIITGNAPDVLYLGSADMQRMINTGVMSDLGGFMDEYDNLKREDFTECALDGLTVDGKIPALMERYNVYTAFAKTKFVGEDSENWTAEKAIEFYNRTADFGEDMMFVDSYDDMCLADYMLKIEGFNCIDIKNKTCNFGDTFSKTLDFCMKNPVKYNTCDSVGDVDNDSQLVYQLMITGFDSWLATQTYFYRGKEDITFVGYPSEDGQGAYVMANGALYGIPETCPDKEKAWDIVCLLMKHHKKLEKHEHDSTIGLPTLRDELKRDYNRHESYANSINANIFTGYYDEQEYLPEDVKDKLYDYIMSVPANPYNADSLSSIMREEIKGSTEGGRSAEETARILDSRIGIYLSEKYE